MRPCRAIPPPHRCDVTWGQWRDDRTGGPHLSAALDGAVLDEILGCHPVYRHDLQSITVDGFGLTHGEQLETLQRFAEEIAPVLRREAASTLWE